MNSRVIPFWPFGSIRAPTAPTPSEAARTLGAIALKNASDRRAAMLCKLRREVRECEITPLRWKA